MSTERRRKTSTLPTTKTNSTDIILLTPLRSRNVTTGLKISERRREIKNIIIMLRN
jgi:hypothetical protein